MRAAHLSHACQRDIWCRCIVFPVEKVDLQRGWTQTQCTRYKSHIGERGGGEGGMKHGSSLREIEIG